MIIPNRQELFPAWMQYMLKQAPVCKLEGEAKAQKTCTASASQMLLQIITRVRNGEQHEHDTEDGLGRLSLSACFTRGCLLGI
jgi:hypothetical protein